MFSSEVQFGHAGACANAERETAVAKNKALADSGAKVPVSFDELGEVCSWRETLLGVLAFPILYYLIWGKLKLRKQWLIIYFQYTFVHFLMYFPPSLFSNFSSIVAADDPLCVQGSARRRNHCAQRGSPTPHCANGLQLGQGQALFISFCTFNTDLNLIDNGEFISSLFFWIHMS